MKEQLLTIINSHNNAIKTLKESELEVASNKLFKAMEIWHRISITGAAITRLARENGINAKCNMQTGEIIIINSPT